MEAALLDRFRADLDALVAPDLPVGIAVSGGPDSLALLLLAAAARPGLIEAATVDHGLRPEAADEAHFVARICAGLGVAHSILAISWSEVPTTAIQEKARQQRYRLLGYWAEDRALEALATAHHADDQAETLVMRLARGSGVRGLAAIRPRSATPGSHVRLVRPLLGWRRAELEEICASAGITPVSDPSNQDERFERIRMRRALAEADWLDPAAIARSAANLAEADAALDWATRNEWKRAVSERKGVLHYLPKEAPNEIQRRIIARAIRRLATEGEPEMRGFELERLLTELKEGRVSTIRGVRCSGGSEWCFAAATPRRA